MLTLTAPRLASGASSNGMEVSSSPNITINDQTPELAEHFGSMIVMDDPRHQRLRSIVSRAFTPTGGPHRSVGAGSRTPTDDHQKIFL